MKKLAIVGIAIIALSLSGCSWNWGWPWFGGDDSGGGSDSSVTAAIQAAEASLKRAGSVGGEWRDSKKKYLKKAKAAAAKGDNATAMKMAKKAKFQGEASYQQAMDQKSAGPWLF